MRLTAATVLVAPPGSGRPSARPSPTPSTLGKPRECEQIDALERGGKARLTEGLPVCLPSPLSGESNHARQWDPSFRRIGREHVLSSLLSGRRVDRSQGRPKSGLEATDPAVRAVRGVPTRPVHSHPDNCSSCRRTSSVTIGVYNARHHVRLSHKPKSRHWGWG